MRRKRIVLFFLIVSTIVSLTSCGKRTSAGPTAENAAATIPDVVQMDVGIRPGAFRDLVSHEEKKSYSVWVNADGAVYRGAKINIRGSTSKGIGLLMPTKRIPFELTFAKGADAIPFFANPSVKFNNGFTAFRLLAEYVALDLFEESGIPTPAHAFSFIRFNDTDFGLYLAVEDVNKFFIAKHFDGNIGSLYKASTHEDQKGAHIYTEWFGHIFSKVDKGSQTLASLLSALDRGSGYEAYLDMDEVLRFLACTTAIGGSGSVITEQNNFLLYDNGGKFVLLPWDLSEAFFTSSDEDGIDRFHLMNDEEKLSPLFELIMRDPENREKYHAYLRQINDTFLSPERMRPYLLSVIRQVAPFLERDQTIYGRRTDLETMMTTGTEYGTENLLAAVEDMHRQLQEQLDGKTDRFSFNEDLFTLPEYEEYEDWLNQFAQSAEGYDATVLDRVCDGYGAWLAVFLKNGLFDAEKDFFISAMIFAPCFLFVLFRRRIVSLLQTVKYSKNRLHPDGDDPNG